MKKVLKFIGNNLRIILMVAIGVVIGEVVVHAATTLFESSEVSYDNSNSELVSGNVQDALDELYGCATEYSSILESIDYLNQSLSNINALVMDNPGFHNSVFRGKDITSYYTDGSLYTRISNGSFEDLYVGDYLVANGVNWRIAGFDIYYGKGDTAFNKHHVVIVPDTSLTGAVMNETNTTEGGYVGSKMYTTTLSNVLSTYITPVFGNHILEHRTLLSIEVNKIATNRLGKATGATSDVSWQTRSIDLMNSVQVTGSIGASSSVLDIMTDSTWFPLFRLKPEFMNKEGWWYWLHDVADSLSFVNFGNNGATWAGASNYGGIRPYFYID